MSSSSSKLSFTVRRPHQPLSRASHGPSSLSRAQSPLDSSDGEDSAQDELVDAFDRFGAQRANARSKSNIKSPLVIPALQNKDWRDVARKRRAVHYVPPSAAAQTGKDGSVGGLGTKDTINSGPVLSGLQIKQKRSIHERNGSDHSDTDIKMEEIDEVESEDQRALRAILAETAGGESMDGPGIEIIPPPVSEEEAFKQDIDELPDAATLDDYARVPVAQFGAALLRGMGWKEGTAATRKLGKGMVEPYLPTARPALLGIGAKEMETLDDGSTQKRRKQHGKERYMPLIKQERSSTNTPTSGTPASGTPVTGSRTGTPRNGRSRSPKRDSATVSRRSSRSPDRSDRDRGYTRDRDRDRYSEKDRDYSRDYGNDRRRGDSDRDRYRDDYSNKDRRRGDGGRRRGDSEKDRGRDR